MTFQKTYRSDRRRAFTLIELLLVISIIAILSALGVSVLSSAEQDALESRTKAGIERISMVLNRKFEENAYRILPVRMPNNATPKENRQFRAEAMAEFLRVEFPFLLVQVDSTSVDHFPKNKRLNGSEPQTLVELRMGDNDRPQIAARYEAKMSGATTKNQSAELLYAILSLNFDEFGQPLSKILRGREIGDTDNDDFFEVLDGFGDPLDFSLRIKLNAQELDDFENPNTPALPPGTLPAGRLLIVRSELHDIVGYEAILDPQFVLNAGNPDHVGLVNVGLLQHVARKLVRDDDDHKLDIYEMFPTFDKYRLSIRSSNLTNSDHGAVVTQ